MKTKLITQAYDLWQFLKFAVKNVWRNRRRAAITMSSIAVGTITLVLLQSYVNTMEMGLQADAIQKQYGHFQIAAKGYFSAEENSAEFVMSREVVQKITAKAMELDSVDFVNTRIHLNGIIGTQKKSTVFMGIAGIPSAEGLMAPTLVKGNLLSDKESGGIMIGKAMAKKLGIDIGDHLIAFVSGANGSQEAIAVNVRGIYEALMPEQEKVIIYMPISSAWDLMLEKTSHRILIFLNKPEKLAQTIQTMQKFINENNLNLEIRDWKTLAVFIKQVIGMFRGMIIVVSIIVFLVIIFNIHNTMHMSIHERFREIGAMRAMGSSRGEIIREFLAEGFIIGLFGALAGIFISLILMPWINAMHLSLPPGPGQTKPTPIMFTQSSVVLINALLVNLVTAFLASILPARKGAKIRIIDALRYV
ncbi:MAG: FtsX-like permease family protein [Spirochaetia bacterium]|nr:FtsX-like permease family protein [Spirochaetia bacterium]